MTLKSDLFNSQQTNLLSRDTDGRQGKGEECSRTDGWGIQWNEDEGFEQVEKAR